MCAVRKTLFVTLKGLCSLKYFHFFLLLQKHLVFQTLALKKKKKSKMPKPKYTWTCEELWIQSSPSKNGKKNSTVFISFLLWIGKKRIKGSCMGIFVSKRTNIIQQDNNSIHFTSIQNKCHHTQFLNNSTSQLILCNYRFSV